MAISSHICARDYETLKKRNQLEFREVDGTVCIYDATTGERYKVNDLVPFGHVVRVDTDVAGGGIKIAMQGDEYIGQYADVEVRVSKDDTPRKREHCDALMRDAISRKIQMQRVKNTTPELLYAA